MMTCDYGVVAVDTEKSRLLRKMEERKKSTCGLCQLFGCGGQVNKQQESRRIVSNYLSYCLPILIIKSI